MNSVAAGAEARRHASPRLRSARGARRGSYLPNSLGVVVLAAGQGTRMKSRIHKVLHPVAGVPLIDYVMRSAQSLSPERIVVVVGHDGEQVRSHLGDSVQFALQDLPRGTGDAVRVARDLLRGRADTVLVLYGDTPLVRTETLRQLVETHEQSGALVTLLTAKNDDPARVLRDERGRVVGIAETSVATPEQLRIPERNCGVCAFDAEWLWEKLEGLRLSAAGEYYLTDLIAVAVAEGERDGRWPVQAVGASDPAEAMGVNDRVQLAEAERVARQRVLRELMMSGVTITDPATTYVEAGVEVGADTVLLPGTHLRGRTRVGAECVIGPNTSISDSEIGDHCRVQWSVVEGSRMDSHSDAGPFTHLRPGTHIESHVHLGNFVEAKSTRIGSGSASGHFSYLGDADVGRNVNIGAGTITCNFDGEKKNPTKIGDGAFIGSDTMLVAPVEVGEGSRTGAGSVVTRDVPPGRTALGVPARLLPRSFDSRKESGEDQSR